MDRQLDLSLPVSARAPRMARQALRPLTDGVAADFGSTLALLVTELVTNSVTHARHARDTIRVRVWALPPVARVAVGDSGGPFEAKVGRNDINDEGGRGLLILDALADCWGVSHDECTWSWFELHGPPGPLDPFIDTVSGWPLRTKTLAWTMLTTLGTPSAVGTRRLSWNGPDGTVVNLVSADPAATPGRLQRGPVADRPGGRWWIETLRPWDPAGSQPGRHRRLSVHGRTPATRPGTAPVRHSADRGHRPSIGPGVRADSASAADRGP